MIGVNGSVWIWILVRYIQNRNITLCATWSSHNFVQSMQNEFNHPTAVADTEPHPFASTISPDVLQVYFRILHTLVTPYIKSNTAVVPRRWPKATRGDYCRLKKTHRVSIGRVQNIERSYTDILYTETLKISLSASSCLDIPFFLFWRLQLGRTAHVKRHFQPRLNRFRYRTCLKGCTINNL